jgi:hypothetical protein
MQIACEKSADRPQVPAESGKTKPEALFKSQVTQKSHAQKAKSTRTSSRAASRKVASMAESTSEEEWSDEEASQPSLSQSSEKSEVVEIQTDDDDEDNKQEKREKSKQAAQQALERSIGSLTYSRGQKTRQPDANATTAPKASETGKQKSDRGIAQKAKIVEKRKRDSASCDKQEKRDESEEVITLDKMKRWKMDSDKRHEREFMDAIEEQAMKMEEEDKALDAEVIKVRRATTVV